MSTTDIVSMHKEFALNGTGVFYLVHHTHVDLLPETGNSRHTRRMGVTHGLLYLLRMCIDNHAGSGIETKNGPSTLEDVGIGQEIHDAVVLVYRHTLVVSHHGSMELSVSQDDAL